MKKQKDLSIGTEIYLATEEFEPMMAKAIGLTDHSILIEFEDGSKMEVKSWDYDITMLLKRKE